MISPASALIWFSVLFLAAVILFSPHIGLRAVAARMRKDRKKILVEDTLKLLYDFYTKKKECRKQDITHSMNLGQSGVEELIRILLEMKLVQLSGDNIIFTGEGKNYAVKIVRIHRLLEKYYAEETSIKEDYWHLTAEDKEHSISEAETESLSAKLGNPLTDPHGDPIPGLSGEHYQPESVSLAELNTGETGIIIHIEDEPPEKYSKVLSLNLTLGKAIKVKEKEGNVIKIESGGEEISVPADITDNIFIASYEGTGEIKTFRRLSDLEMNEEAYIEGISKTVRGQQRRRLLDFGFTPGSKISVRLISIGKDPIAYDIKNTTVALRRQQAEQIFVKDSVEEADYGRN